MMRNIQYIALLILGTFLHFSCDREEPFDLPAPSLVLLTPTAPQIVQEPGNDIYLEFNVLAPSGLNSFIVLKDGEMIDEVNYTTEISSKYVFEYTVPFEQAIGTTNEFEFLVTDSQDRSARFDLSVLIRSTFSEVVETVNGVEVTKIKGKLNNDYRFEIGKTYLIDSILSVENGATLTIDPGSVVYFKTYPNPNEFSHLAILRDSRIIAEGSKDDPIVFTSDKVLLNETPAPNDWGGIFILGNAPTNAGNTVIVDGYRYGGNRPNDNSGTLKYVRVEYAGKSGYHGMHFFGVGSQTIVENLQIYRNENIAVRVRGGRLNFKYLAGIGHGGYGIWCDEGWQGNGQFWLFQTDRQATLVPVNFWNIARSIEMRNNDGFFETQPRTTFRISNVTLIGNGYEQGVNNGTRRGVRIRTGARGILQNMIVTQFPDDGVRVEDLPVSDFGQQMTLGNTFSFNNARNYEQDAPIFANDPSYNVNETAAAGITLNNFVGVEPTTFNPSSLGSFFTSAPFAGAVHIDNDWTADGNWFKNLDGTIR
ncbi:hypothetical protein MM239_19055 [Belliella sp. DSM 111904]|uniref:Right handed beta helix region n=1 Tax=Belliella filtrata TaxID=2923435 RepID=A0ABS9V5S8_9BACT|nr:hypothetical protein [Belliella filtrata]MCH7411495.1 hypothetical protein [Belliella filtrata]